MPVHIGINRTVCVLCGLCLFEMAWKFTMFRWFQNLSTQFYFLFSVSFGLKSFQTVFCKYALRLIMSLSKYLKTKYKEMIYECCPSSTELSHLEIPKSIKKIITSFTELERGTEDIGVVYRRNNLPLGVWCVCLHPGCRCTIC